METTEREVKSRVNQTNPSQSEGQVATKLEQQTAKIPSDVWLWAAFGSIGASLVLKLMNRDSESVFVGQWAPSFMLLGIYNKLVKQLGHD
jgi:hypothetical protein